VAGLGRGTPADVQLQRHAGLTRDSVKRVRDVRQAHAVAAIINEHYPLLPFRPEHLACFPRRAADLGADADFFRLP